MNQKILDEANKVLGPIKAKQQKCSEDKSSLISQMTKMKTAIKTAEKSVAKDLIQNGSS